jgi:hypothetical protein
MNLVERFKKHKDYRPRKGDIKLCNSSHARIDDNGFLEIDSYGNGWHILKNIGGLYVFNWYNYSNTTRKHQYLASQLVKEFGIDYITFESSNGLKYDYSLKQILESKIKSIYDGENKQSLRNSNAKYSIFSESDFNDLMKDIQTIAAHIKMKNAELDKLLIEAENKATQKLLETYYQQSERRDSLKEAKKELQNFEAVAV